MPTIESFYQNQGVEVAEKETTVRTVTLFPKSARFDHARRGVLKDIQDLGIESVQDAKVGRVFLFEGFTSDSRIIYDDLIKFLLQEKTAQLDQFKLWAKAKSVEVTNTKTQTEQNLTLYDDQKTTLDSIDLLTTI